MSSTAYPRRSTRSEEPHAALRPQPAQGVPAAQPSPSAHRLLHRHVQLAGTASDPSGSRRFICVLVKHPIDSTGIDHAQIYAQLKAELERGNGTGSATGKRTPCGCTMRLYRICQRKRCCVVTTAPRIRARRYARFAAEIFARLRRLEPGAMAGVTLPKLAQALVAAGVQKVHTHYGNRYRVAER